MFSQLGLHTTRLIKFSYMLEILHDLEQVDHVALSRIVYTLLIVNDQTNGRYRL